MQGGRWVSGCPQFATLQFATRSFSSKSPVCYSVIFHKILSWLLGRFQSNPVCYYCILATFFKVKKRSIKKLYLKYPVRVSLAKHILCVLANAFLRYVCEPNWAALQYSHTDVRILWGHDIYSYKMCSDLDKRVIKRNQTRHFIICAYFCENLNVGNVLFVLGFKHQHVQFCAPLTY